MTMHTVKTGISVIDMNTFKMFLSAANIKDVIVGMHQVRINKYQVDNFIEYSYSDKEDTMVDLTSITLRYGSLELAFIDFLKKVNRIPSLDYTAPL